MNPINTAYICHRSRATREVPCNTAHLLRFPDPKQDSLSARSPFAIAVMVYNVVLPLMTLFLAWWFHLGVLITKHEQYDHETNQTNTNPSVYVWERFDVLGHKV